MLVVSATRDKAQTLLKSVRLLSSKSKTNRSSRV